MQTIFKRLQACFFYWISSSIRIDAYDWMVCNLHKLVFNELWNSQSCDHFVKIIGWQTFDKQFDCRTKQNNPSSFYMFWMKFDWKKWAGRLIGRSVGRSYIELWRWNTHVKCWNNCKAYLIMCHSMPFLVESVLCKKQKYRRKTYEPMIINAFVGFFISFSTYTNRDQHH